MKLMTKVNRTLALLVNSLAVFVLLAFPFAPTVRAEPHTTFTVNANPDMVDFLPGDGVCETAAGNGMCTLRAAIMEANAHIGADTIMLPAATYHLTILGADENLGATGDLDITESLTIIGPDPALAVISAAGLGDRVLHIPDASDQVFISWVRVQGGSVGDFSYGGGIYNFGVLNLENSELVGNTAGQGGGGIMNLKELDLQNVLLLSNNASQGAGIFIDIPGETTLVNVTFQYNDASSWGGGIVNFGTLSVQDSHFYTNTADTIGGGIYLWDGSAQIINTTLQGNDSSYGGGIYINAGADLTLTGSDVVTNTAAEDGGGIYNLGTLAIQDGTIDKNTAVNAGGGIAIVDNASATLTNVSITNNHAVMVGGGIWIALDATFTGENLLFDSNSTDNYGGAINSQGALLLQRSVLRDNSADHGGAIITNLDSNTTIAESSIISNTAASTGGGITIAGSMTLKGVTLSDNQSPYGGAIYNSGTFSMENSTVSQNSAGENGAGIYNFSEASIYNSTITGNVAGTNFLPPAGVGGGVYTLETAATYLRNSILFGNYHRLMMDWVADDCSGPLSSGDYNLVGTLHGCTLIDPVEHNLIGVDPLLGELAENGGPTQTHALQEGSPAIDAGNPAGCQGIGDIPLVTDQRGEPRPVDGDRDGTATCDIGAYELVTYTFVYLPLIER